MTLGQQAIEMLFGGRRECDLCRKPATAFHVGYSRCQDHPTEDMIRSLGRGEERGDPGLSRVVGLLRKGVLLRK